MVLSFVGVAVPEMAAPWLLSSFSVMVAVDGDREKVFARGPRWVSFSSKVTMLLATPHFHPQGPQQRNRICGDGRGSRIERECNVLLVSFHDMFAKGNGRDPRPGCRCRRAGEGVSKGKGRNPKMRIGF